MAHHIMSSGRNHLALRAPEGDQDQDNPFAPPPEGTPDRPWQPRRPDGSGDADSGTHGSTGPSGSSGSSDPSGSGGTPPPPPPGRRPGAPQAWGHQWGNQQPQDGRPNPHQGPNGPQGTGPRFDPTDPAQRRSRYALVCGGWGLIFAVLGWVEVGLLLGALALYWGISALRMTPEDRAEARATAASALADATQTPRPTPPAPGPDAQRSFMTAAWSGIVTSAVTIAIVASSFALHLAYRDYYTCKQDALTHPASQACQKLLPEPLRSIPALRG
ncbi:hypothetical protein [Streptomyces sp. NPDC049040]|uniref:hypothetical protein n=1 Tax=Streptomyces sp. NPDC049040 TaxID=3365593 RepID=UPI00372250B9